MSRHLGPFDVILALGAAAVYAYVAWREPRRRARREIRKLKDTSLGAMKVGDRVRVTGVVAPHRKPAVAPVSGRPCVGYRLRIEMQTSQWKETFRDLVFHEECRGFTIADESGSAIVRGPFVLGVEVDSRTWTTLSPEVIGHLEKKQLFLGDAPRPEQEVYVTETILAVGDRIRVVGRVSADKRIIGDRESPVMIADAADTD